MKESLKFNSQVCTSIEQSKRLLSLGIKPEIADMVYHYTNSRIGQLKWELRPHRPNLIKNTKLNVDRLNVFGIKKADGKVMTGEEYFNELWGKDVPAWSLHRLIKIAEVSVEVYGLFIRISSTYYYEEKDNVYENLIDAISELINNEVFNKEYLKQ